VIKSKPMPITEKIMVLIKRGAPYEIKRLLRSKILSNNGERNKIGVTAMAERSISLNKYKSEKTRVRLTVTLGFLRRKMIKKTVFAALAILKARAMPAPGAGEPCQWKCFTRINAKAILTAKEIMPAKVGDYFLCG